MGGRLGCQGWARGYGLVVFRDVSFQTLSLFLRIKETGTKLIKSCQNMDNISIVCLSKDRLDSGKELDNPSLNTISTHLDQIRLSSD